MTRSFKTLITIYFVLFLSGLAMAAFVIATESPDQALPYVYILIYSGTFLAALGVGGVVGVVLRYWFGSQVEVFTNQKVTARQSILLGFLAVSSLYLQYLRLLNIYTMGLLVLFFFIIELMFLNRTKNKAQAK